MLGKRTVVLLFFVASWSLPSARADNGLLVVGGGAEEHDRTVVRGAIASAMQSAGWSLPTSLLTRSESDDLLNCPDFNAPWSCVPASVGAGGVRGVFVVSVDGTRADNGTPMVVITGKLIVTNPPSFTVGQRFCEYCVDDKLGRAGEDLTHQLVREIASRSGRTSVRITSVPVGAEIILDGMIMGATDATFSTFPGPHVVIVQKLGFDAQPREFTAEQGKTVALAFTLHPSGELAVRDPDPAPPGPPPSTHLVPGVVIGAGATLTVFGGLSFYRGQHDGVGGKFDYTRATAVGVTSGLVGLGALGVGLYLLWIDLPRAAPSASPTPGGAIVSWMGRF
jgi:hypothetical protein